jgi:hypothetical protein
MHGQVIEVRLKGLFVQATVEWDVSPSDNTGKRGFGFGMRQSVDEEMNHQVEISKTGKTQREATVRFHCKRDR